jgi:hypothetical protein
MKEQKSKKETRNIGSSGFILIAGLLIAVIIPLVVFTYTNLKYPSGFVTEPTIDTASDFDVTRFYVDEDGYLELPAGWEVIGFDVATYLADNSALAEMGVQPFEDTPVPEPENGHAIDWFGPIFHYTTINISKDYNTITMVDLTTYEPALSGTLPATVNMDTATVLVKPTATAIGVLRSTDTRHPDQYTYSLISLNPEHEEGSDEVMYIYNHTNKGFEFKYNGVETLLPEVDGIFKNACLADQSTWCELVENEY